MEDPTARRTGLRVLRLVRPDKGAVSGVVAASLGVVLISVLLAMVVTFWVPAWGYDNEVTHSREVLNAFGQFKSTVETVTLSANTNQTVGIPFTLGVGAVPLFGAETPGVLSHQYIEGGAVRFRATLTDSRGDINLSAAGSLEYSVSNRYYERQTIAYESGAVVIQQAGGSTMRLPPPLRVTNASQGLEVALSLFTLEGEQAVISGVETHIVNTRLTVAYTLSYTWTSNNTLYLNLTTSFVDGWAKFLNDSIGASGVNASLYGVTRNATADPGTVSLQLAGVRTLTVTVSLVNVRVE